MSLIPIRDAAHAARGMCARRLPAGAVLLLGMLVLAGPTRAQVADPTLWVTDGFVSAMAFSGDTLYIGGAFTYVGPNTGGFVGIDVTTSRQHGGWPRVEGAVFGIVTVMAVFSGVERPKLLVTGRWLVATVRLTNRVVLPRPDAVLVRIQETLAPSELIESVWLPGLVLNQRR